MIVVKYIDGFEYMINKIWEYRLYIPKNNLEDFDNVIQTYINVLEEIKKTNKVFPIEHDKILLEARKYLVSLDKTYNSGYTF